MWLTEHEGGNSDKSVWLRAICGFIISSLSSRRSQPGWGDEENEEDIQLGPVRGLN